MKKALTSQPSTVVANDGRGHVRGNLLVLVRLQTQLSGQRVVLGRGQQRGGRLGLGLAQLGHLEVDNVAVHVEARLLEVVQLRLERGQVVLRLVAEVVVEVAAEAAAQVGRGVAGKRLARVHLAHAGDGGLLEPVGHGLPLLAARVERGGVFQLQHGFLELPRLEK